MFEKDFQHPNSKFQLIQMDKNKTFTTIGEINMENNIYFQYGLKKDSVTRKREDILHKRGFFIDIDLRNNLLPILSTNEDIIAEGENIGKYLGEEHKALGEWSYIIYTGNGLQIHYLGDWKEYTPEDYSLGVSAIYKIWDDYIDSYIYKCDPACKDISRIARMPGTINQKNGAKTFIIAHQEKNSSLANNINNYANIARERAEKARQDSEKLYLKDYKNSDYIAINNIPAYVIAQKIIPRFPLSKNGKNFDNEKGGYTGYYYVKETNTICNGGSRYFNWGDDSSCWNNFAIIKHHYNYSNSETFKYFKTLLNK